MFTSGSPAPSSRFTKTAGKEEGCGARTSSASNIKKEIRLRLDLHHVAKHVPPPAHASPSCPASRTTTSSRVPCLRPP